MVAETVQYVKLVGIIITPQPAQSVHLYRVLLLNIQPTYAFHWKGYLFYSLSFTEVCAVYGVLQRCNVLLSCSTVTFRKGRGK